LNIHIIEGRTKFKSSMAVTQGAHKCVDIKIWENCNLFAAEMKRSNRRILVAAMDGAQDVYKMEISQPVVLVFGNEAEGISREMFELADGAFKIPMYGFVESFNVSVAAAISVSALRHGRVGDLCDVEKKILKARYYMRAVRAGFDIVMVERERA
jgi:tRNA (guanosine-2'-O-)-methyltransferase